MSSLSIFKTMMDIENWLLSHFQGNDRYRKLATFKVNVMKCLEVLLQLFFKVFYILKLIFLKIQVNPRFQTISLSRIMPFEFNGNYVWQN